MSYQVHNFQTWEIIEAAPMNEMDQQIRQNESDISSIINAKGAASGFAELDENGKIPSSQLPSYVDDVLEYNNTSSFPSTGESGKIYVALDTNKTYRWGGSEYVEISSSITLGTTSSTAFRGDYGQSAYTHAVTNKGAAFSSGLYKITTNSEGHVTYATDVTKNDITGLGIPGSVPTKVSDLTDDSGHYTKPSGGIPSSDLATAVQTSLGKADSAYQKPGGGIPASDLASDISTTISGKLDSTLKGVANGVAELDANGKVPSSQLPSYVDDVLEYASIDNFPAEGETGKIYIAIDTNKSYRWSGSAYIEISSSITLGETSSTAYRGDRGKTAYDHAYAKGSAFLSGLYKITTNSEGHVTAATSVTKSDITSLGIAESDSPVFSGTLTLGSTSMSESQLQNLLSITGASGQSF